ncbi:hypothetical protein DPMN_170974 [Dreissena polymorpha]|uniref:Uncharacterized protein n=1 Tax=Dreissena polymorpha TaxID=45954 RepID=A0A9D4IDC0_DREPO|nr:hypothetical protein DPMN_170974 [Dreissena polymorpha]
MRQPLRWRKRVCARRKQMIRIRIGIKKLSGMRERKEHKTNYKDVYKWHHLLPGNKLVGLRETGNEALLPGLLNVVKLSETAENPLWVWPG